MSWEEEQQVRAAIPFDNLFYQGFEHRMRHRNIRNQVCKIVGCWSEMHGIIWSRDVEEGCR